MIAEHCHFSCKGIADEGGKRTRMDRRRKTCKRAAQEVMQWFVFKKSSPAVDFEEVNRVLLEFSTDYPIYQFVDRLRPFRAKSEEKRDPVYEARIERLKREQVVVEYSI